MLNRYAIWTDKEDKRKYDKKVKENKIFVKNQIDGISVIAVDGVEEFETNKKIEGLPKRKHKDGRISEYYKTLGIASVGEKIQILIGLEELEAKESKEVEEKIEKETKDKKISEERKQEKIKVEGEVTVIKRILPEIRKEIGQNIDVIVLDALFANAPVLNTIKENKMDAVVRFKEERREIYKDAMGMFEKRKADMTYEIVEEKKSIITKYSKESHKKNKTKKKVEIIEREITKEEIGKSIEKAKYTTKKGKIKRKIRESEKVIKRVKVWEDKFDLTNYEYGKVRFIKYDEELADGKHKIICVITTLLNQDLKTILKIMHARWMIENNVFRVLKDRYNLDHCYVGELNAIRLINQIIILVYNLVNLYIKIRTQEFRNRNITARILKKIFESQIAANRKIYLLFSNNKASV